MSIVLNNTNHKLQDALDKRVEDGLYRQLQTERPAIDFCSNDYLSFARSTVIAQRVNSEMEHIPATNGATGSRSISGSTSYAERLEQYLAGFHNAEAALLFNSGYDANLGLFSAIAKKEDTLVTDELIHASIIDGCRLSYANRLRFAHNDTNDLEKKLKKIRESQTRQDASIFVAVESVYSMDGDIAPLNEMVMLCRKYSANLIVDEAHATGVFGRQGRGLVNESGLEEEVFARVHTFGKALGCHGAVVVGPRVLRNYLINFARSFIFTTALPLHSLITIRQAYEYLQAQDFNTRSLDNLIGEFKNGFPEHEDFYLIKSRSPIQSLVIPGASRVKAVAKNLQAMGFDVRAIVSPSVPAGKERLRISLHLHNSEKEVQALKQAILQILAA